MKAFAGIVAVSGLFASVSAQVAPYTDARSGISYQQWANRDLDFSFSWALPKDPADTMMGLLTASNKAGWVGISFGGGMRNSLLLVAWNNKGNLTGDLRFTSSYSMPRPYEGKTNPIFAPLACGSGFNDTHWYLAFACQDCNKWTNAAGQAKGGFDLKAASTKFGWAWSEQAPGNPGDPRSPVPKHNEAGRITAPLDRARTDRFDQQVEQCGGEDDDEDDEASATDDAPGTGPRAPGNPGAAGPPPGPPPNGIPPRSR